MESCLDIASHIVSYQGYRAPGDNQDIFQVLIEEKILDKELGEQLKKMVCGSSRRTSQTKSK
ncbi:DUF86 domain-containing protein [Natranaerofaba carboxydovora]|uniref:DUF86 domain-containing protein n=1 Tax=Natranaerofaba carboxydovora TaxID=2742683 RepID=UPI003B846520